MQISIPIPYNKNTGKITDKQYKKIIKGYFNLFLKCLFGWASEQLWL